MRTTLTTLCIAAAATLAAQNDSITFKLKLRDINPVLTFNQPHVAANALEYAWEIKINSDNNVSTGDSRGFDVGIAIVNYKYGSSNTYTGSIISGTDQYTRIFSGNTISYGNQVNAYFVPADTAIVIAASASFPELQTINCGDQMFLYTYFNSPTGIETDSIPLTQLNNTTFNDALNDVASSFMDIKSLEAFVPLTTSLKKIVDHSELIVYPNPCNTRLFVQGANDTFEVKIVDATGKLMIQANSREINTENLPRGFYQLIIHTDKGTNTSKVIIQ